MPYFEYDKRLWHYGTVNAPPHMTKFAVTVVIRFSQTTCAKAKIVQLNDCTTFVRYDDSK